MVDQSSAVDAHGSAHELEWLKWARDIIRQAKKDQYGLIIEGQGSKAFYGQPVQTKVNRLSTLGYRGIINYDPSELFIVARAGTPLSDIEQALADQQQRLAFDPPRFGGKGTVGGMVATGLSGPCRLSAGPCRDYVLGLTLMNGDGQQLRFGGTVMKNVAGYDMSRLQVGAMGILGLLLDISLKVLPEPAARVTLRLACSAKESLEHCDRWLAKPLPLSATAYSPDGLLTLQFSGAASAVASAVDYFSKTYGAQLILPSEASAFWDSLRDQCHDFFSKDLLSEAKRLWRISLPAQTPLLTLSGQTLMEWGGCLRWLRTDAPEEEIREQARVNGGHATLYRTSDKENLHSQRFMPLPPTLLKLHQRLKRSLDPHGVFNPGRLYPEL